MNFSYRETRVQEPEHLREILESASRNGHLGSHSVDEVIAACEEVLERYGKKGLDTVCYEQKDGENERGVLTFHTLHPRQPLNPDARHGAGCVFFADFLIEVAGARESITSRFVVSHRRGLKAKNFEKIYNDAEAFENAIKRGLIKPGKQGITGGSVDPGEMDPMTALCREIAEELGLIGEGDGVTQRQIAQAVSKYIPVETEKLIPISAALDLYQEGQPLLALGYAANISAKFAVHLEKAAAVERNNREFLEGRKSLQQWKEDGGYETLDYGQYPTGGTLSGDAQALILKALRDDMAQRQTRAAQLEVAGRADEARRIINSGVDVDAMNLVTQGQSPVDLRPEEIDRLRRINRYFVEPSRGETFCYRHEAIFVFKVQKDGLSLERDQVQDVSIDQGSGRYVSVGREQLIDYVQAHLRALWKEGALGFGKERVKVQLSKYHVQQILAQPNENEPLQKVMTRHRSRLQRPGLQAPAKLILKGLRRSGR
jgi:hypothetical protein